MEKKEETKIPIAWDLISKAPNSGYSERESCIDWDDINDIMIKFAKLHVQEALKQASEKAELRLEKYSDDWYIDRSSILNAYSLDLIK
jgi:hypothetical protein